MESVGHGIPRVDCYAKVTGAARYVDDVVFPGMFHGRTIRSTVACGRVRAIRLGFGREAGIVVVDHRGIPGRNVVTLIEDDQPFLAEGRIRHVAEPILLLAGANRERLLAAEVEIDYDEAEPILDAERSPDEFKRIRLDRGDVARGLAEADVVVEGEYRTGHQEQLHIEPNGVIAVPEDGGITVYGSLQCPFYVHRALTVLLGLPDEKVRVVQTETGGGCYWGRGGNDRCIQELNELAADAGWRVRLFTLEKQPIDLHARLAATYVVADERCRAEILDEATAHGWTHFAVVLLDVAPATETPGVEVVDGAAAHVRAREPRRGEAEASMPVS